MIKLSYPEKVKTISGILRDNGFSSYAVGGCIRDSIMEREPYDWDITTNALPDDMLDVFNKSGLVTVPTGLKHGTVSVIIDRLQYECTTFRIDGSYVDSRHPSDVTFTSSIENDLKRRDFTINAMAGDPLDENGKIIDLFGGMRDIENKIISCVGDPILRFSEDALRILRAVRFAAVLNFTIEEETKRAAKALGHKLVNISTERKKTEFEKLIMSDHADYGLSLLFELDLAKYIHPDIKPPRVKLENLPRHFPTRLAATLMPCGDICLSCLKLSNTEASQTKALCDLSRVKPEYTETNARFLLSVYGDLAKNAANLVPDDRLCQIIEQEQIKNPCVRIRDLAINGNHLTDLGLRSRAISLTLSYLLGEVIKNQELNNTASLIELAKKYNHIL